MTYYFSKLSALLKQSEAVRQSITVSVGNIITSGLMAVVLILSARILGPEQFGVFSVVTAIMIIAAKATDLGMHQLIPRLFHRWQKHPELQAAFMQWQIRWKVRLTFVMLILSGLLVPVLQQVIHSTDPVLLWSALLGAIILSWYEFIHLALASLHRFLALSIMSISQALVKFFGFGVIAVLAGSVSDSMLLRSFVLIYCAAPLTAFIWNKVLVTIKKETHIETETLKELDTNEIKEEKIKHQKTIAQAARRFLPHAFVGTVTMVLIQNIDILLVNNQLSAFETGIYSGAVRVSLVISLITYAISSVLNNRITRYETPERIKGYLSKSLLLSILSLIGFVLFIPLAQPIIVYTIGSEYISGLIPFIILIGNAFIGLALVPYTSFFFRLDVPWANSVGGLLQLLPLLLLNFFYLTQFGLPMAAIARVVSTGLFALLVAWLVWRSWKKNFADAL